MAACFQLYKKSTLPPLLDSYLPVNCRNQHGSNQQKIEADNKGRTRKSNTLSEEEKEKLIQQAVQEQHHLETYKNLYKLRNILCKRYRTLLNEKVQKQRIQIKMSDLRSQQHLKPKAEKCIPSHKVPFCKLSHDTKYLETIPQSSSYMIIGLQNELTKLGIIKSQQDYENFWKLAQGSIHGSKLKEKLPDIKTKMVATKSLSVCTSARTNLLQPVNGCINSSQLKKSTASLLQSADSCQPLDHLMSKQIRTHQETEQMFPQKKIGKRRRKSEQDLHCLRHMYYFSLLNMALSKRLIEQNGQFSDARKEQHVHDLMEYLFPNWHEQSGVNQNKIIEENTAPSLVGAKQQEIHHKETSKVVKVSKEKKKMLNQKKDVEIAEDQKCNITTFARHETIAVPLTLEDVALYHPVVEAKPLGPYWTNYADKEMLTNYNTENY